MNDKQVFRTMLIIVAPFVILTAAIIAIFWPR